MHAVVSVYFNESPGQRFTRWALTSEMVRSRHFSDLPVSIPGAVTLTDLAEGVFALGNADDRPNGRTERSISVGDVIVIRDRNRAAGAVMLAVGPIGFEEIDAATWTH